MGNDQNCYSYINIASSQTYRSYSRILCKHQRSAHNLIVQQLQLTLEQGNQNTAKIVILSILYVPKRITVLAEHRLRAYTIYCSFL
jgi:hypothetical protein